MHSAVQSLIHNDTVPYMPCLMQQCCVVSSVLM